MAAAEAMLAAPQSRRDAGEILVSTMRDGDTIYQHLYQRFRSGTATEADLTAMGAWVDRTNRLAKTVLDARIDERRTRLAEEDGRVVVGVIQRALDSVLGEVLNALSGHDQARDLVVAAWQAGIRPAVARELRALSPAEVAP